LIHYSDLTLKASFHHTPATARAAFALLRSGRFDCNGFLTGSAGLDEVPEVFKDMLTRPAEGIAPQIKTVIYPQAIEADALPTDEPLKEAA
jgi:L-iditol 2-dehydrogenase